MRRTDRPELVLKFNAKLVPVLVLTLLLAAGVAILYRMPVQRYVVTCERTGRAACILEQSSGGRTSRTTVPVEAGTSAVVRYLSQRRGDPRVLLYLSSPARSDFAAEFEGGDAGENATRAAERLNAVLRGGTSATARIEAVPPPYLRWLSWGGLGVMALLTLALYRDARRRSR